jgi:hypothetical protein
MDLFVIYFANAYFASILSSSRKSKTPASPDRLRISS